MKLVAEPTLVEALLGIGESVFKPVGTTLFEQGTPAAGVYVLKAGRAALTLKDKTGRDTLIRRATKHAILGLPGVVGEGRYTLTAEVLQDAEFSFIPAARLTSLMLSDPQSAMAIVRLLSEEVRYLRSAIADPSKLTQAS